LRVPIAAIPISCYLGVTLLAPALNGASARAGFGEHVAITLAVTGLLAALWLGVNRLARRGRRRS
jgi:hypothetical protein